MKETSRNGLMGRKLRLDSGTVLQFSAWAPLSREEISSQMRPEPGLYLLGVQLQPDQDPITVYIGSARDLRVRLLHYVALIEKRQPSAERRPIVQALRQVPANLWRFAWSAREQLRELEAELIIWAMVYWPEDPILNVQENATTSGLGSPYLVEQLLDQVRQFHRLLPAVEDLRTRQQPWIDQGVSRATWYRRRKARQLKEQGHSEDEIAQILRVGHDKVLRWLEGE